MRILVAFFCMSLIGLVATVLAVVSALMQMLPVVLVAVAVLAVLWWRRRAAAAANIGHKPAAPAVIAARPVQPRPLDHRPVGWVLMPVWTPPASVPERHHYIDAEILSEDHQHD